MYIRYATEKDICNELAKYKKGDHVVTLTEIRSAEGIIEAGTRLQIIDVNVADNCFLPLDIARNKIDEYVAP